MASLILFDDEHRNQLLPFTHTRAVADILCGSLTMRQRWEHYFKTTSGTLTQAYLQRLYGNEESEGEWIYANAAVVATATIKEAIAKLQLGQTLVFDDRIVAAKSNSIFQNLEDLGEFLEGTTKVSFQETIHILRNNWDIFKVNGSLQCADFSLVAKGEQAGKPANTILVSEEQIFISSEATVGVGVILNATKGPIYLAAGAEILDGAMIQGPVTILENSVVKMGSKIYGETTIGPGCKVGGEVSNVVLFANSNKGHEGYLGNSVIGEWCNLGADTNSSNLKNNYDEVKIWDEYKNKSVKTGLQFCGLLMGDHSKCGINTMFNTGTVVGVSANIYGAGFPEKFIPSFSWGGADGQTTYQLARALQTAERVMNRRKQTLTDDQKEVLTYIFSKTEKQREIFSSSM